MMDFEAIAVNPHDIICIAAREADDEEVFNLFVGQGGSKEIPFSESAQVEDLVDLISAPVSWHDEFTFVALTGEGSVIYLGPVVRVEQIPGAGYTSRGARNYGRMSSLVVSRDRLFALGYGGQVYVKDAPGSDWQFISDSFPRELEDTTVFYTVLEQTIAGELLLGGEYVPPTLITDELWAADSAGDALKVAELLLKGSKPDRGVLWRKNESSWQLVELPTELPVTFLDRLGDNTLVCCSRAMFILGSFSEEILPAPIEPGASVKSLFRFEGDLFALIENNLTVVDVSRPPSGFLGPIPTEEQTIAVAASGTILYALSRTQILSNDGFGWQNLRHNIVGAASL